MSPPTVIVLATFLIGLLFGSFLNVCISRLPAHESIVSPRSRCPQCGHTIRWYDNIPILSFIFLRARCRDCQTKIPWRYPAVELAVGTWFAVTATKMLSLFSLYVSWLSVARWQPHRLDLVSPTLAADGVALIGTAILGFLLIGLLVMDWQTLRLPDAFTLTGIAIGFAFTCAQAAFLPSGVGDIVFNTTHQLRLSSPGSSNALGNVFLTGTEALVLGRILAITVAALVLLCCRWIYFALRRHQGLGLGDVKLLAMIAAFLGFWSAMLALFLGVVSAAIFGLIQLARRRAGTQSKLPLGSFLAVGGLIAALSGPAIISWYISLIR